MSEAFIGEIRIFTGTYAPLGWADCNGQMLPIVQNTALFSLIGNMYGGDGKTNFALPNLIGRAPLQQGQGLGLANYPQAQARGDETITLTQGQIPAHLHQVKASSTAGNQTDPNGMGWAMAGVARGVCMYTDVRQPVQMNHLGFGSTGDNQPHNNRMPYLALRFIIAMQGYYPIRP